MLDNPELMELFLPMLRADFKMVDEYKSGVSRVGSRLVCHCGTHHYVVLELVSRHTPKAILPHHLLPRKN